MVIKRKDVVEIITPDPWVTRKKTKRKRTKSKEKEDGDEGTPLRGIFCLKTRQDTKIFDEKEDCFILDFDPNDSFDAKTQSETPESDEDVAIVHEKGQVACRDYPHPRHLCLKFPFESSQHKSHCNQCYCYVCDLAAPCAHWTSRASPHCEALENSRWKPLRELHRNHRITTKNATLEKKKYEAAPCAHWMSKVSPHCEALENSRWKPLRELHHQYQQADERLLSSHGVLINKNETLEKKSRQGETTNVNHTPVIRTPMKNSGDDIGESSCLLGK